jgi:hypothetical protein
VNGEIDRGLICVAIGMARGKPALRTAPNISA